MSKGISSRVSDMVSKRVSEMVFECVFQSIFEGASKTVPGRHRRERKRDLKVNRNSILDEANYTFESNNL